MRYLLAIGPSLIVLGVVLRGGTATLRREIARARQHERATGESGGSADLVLRERRLSRLALAAIGLGSLLTLAGLLGR